MEKEREDGERYDERGEEVGFELADLIEALAESPNLERRGLGSDTGRSMEAAQEN